MTKTLMRDEVDRRPWPDGAHEAGDADVVMCAHVVYDVPLIEAFIASLHAHARRGVVVEMTTEHPWVPMGRLFKALHDLDRPAGPTYEDLVAVIVEITGVAPNVELWSRSGQLWFTGWDEILEYFGRRVVLPRSRRAELRELLEDDVTELDGRLYIGDHVRRLATVWWRTT